MLSKTARKSWLELVCSSFGTKCWSHWLQQQRKLLLEDINAKRICSTGEQTDGFWMDFRNKVVPNSEFGDEGCYLLLCFRLSLLVTLVPATNSFQERLFSIKCLALGDLQRRNQGSKVCISANTEYSSIQPWPFHLKCITCQVYFTSQLICHLSICTGGSESNSRTIITGIFLCIFLSVTCLFHSSISKSKV